MTRAIATNPFIGREREMAELTAALEGALDGRGGLVMLVGEPGIGKTRMTEELEAVARHRGAQVPWGACYEGGSTPPYWPWIQAIRSLLTEPSEAFLTALEARAAVLAEIVPEIRDMLPELPPAPEVDPEQARFRLFDSVTSFLNKAAASHPLVVVLEDLHWADRSTLALLEFVAREVSSRPMLLIGGYRDMELSRRHPLSETLAELARGHGFQRIPLRGLDTDDVGRLIEAVGGIAPPPALVEEIHDRTEGNPFFVAEVTRDLAREAADRGGRFDSAGSFSIPDGVREAIGTRLNRLSEECNQALRTAAVIGREFALELMKGLLAELSPEYSEERLLEVLEEALSAGVIEEIPEAAGRCRFTHVLIQETLSQEFSAARRARLHGEIGEALEGLYADDVEAHADELAYHFAGAEPALGSPKLVRYSLMAGERALATYAWEEALGHFQRGLAARGVALTGAAPAGDAEAAELLFGLGQAQEGTQERLWSGSEILACFHRAFDYYAGAGDVGRAVDVAAHHISSNIGADLIAKALELVPPDSHDAGRLLSRYIFPLRADYERAQGAFHRALAIAQQQQDMDLEMITLVAGACLNFVECDFQESLDHNLRAIELAVRVDHPVSEAHARYDLTHVLYALGNLEGAASQAAAMSGVAERLGSRAWQINAIEANENVSSARGDWKAAREFTEQGLALDPGHILLLGSRALLEYQVGDFHAGEAYLERLLESIQRSQSGPSAPITMADPWYAVPAVLIPAVARITGAATRFDVAEAIAQRAMSSPYVQLGVKIAARMGLALMAVQRGDPVAAGKQYGALVSMRGTMCPQCPLGHALGADRVLGLLSRTAGKPERAMAHFEDALAFCRKAGFGPELAWTSYDYAAALLQRDEPGDQATATSMIDQALAISTELGMRPLTEKVSVLKREAECRGAQSTPPAYPAGLTGREVEVLLLMAKGKTTREIADELVISPRTVQRHTTNLYAKINARNRAEATAFVLNELAASKQAPPGR